MEDTSQNKRPSPSFFLPCLEYGLYIGVGYAVAYSLLFLVGLHQNQMMGWFLFLLFASGIVFTIHDFKRKEGGGFMTYGQGVGAGVLNGLFAAIFLSIFFYVFFKYVDPSLIQEMLDQARKQMKDQGVPDSMIRQNMEFAKIFVQPLWLSITQFFSLTFFSLVVSLIGTAFLKRNPDR